MNEFKIYNVNSLLKAGLNIAVPDVHPTKKHKYDMVRYTMQEILDSGDSNPIYNLEYVTPKNKIATVGKLLTWVSTTKQKVDTATLDLNYKAIQSRLLEYNQAIYDKQLDKQIADDNEQNVDQISKFIAANKTSVINKIEQFMLAHPEMVEFSAYKSEYTDLEYKAYTKDKDHIDVKNVYSKDSTESDEYDPYAVYYSAVNQQKQKFINITKNSVVRSCYFKHTETIIDSNQDAINFQSYEYNVKKGLIKEDIDHRLAPMDAHEFKVYEAQNELHSLRTDLTWDLLTMFDMKDIKRAITHITAEGKVSAAYYG